MSPVPVATSRITGEKTWGVSGGAGETAGAGDAGGTVDASDAAGASDAGDAAGAGDASDAAGEAGVAGVTVDASSVGRAEDGSPGIFLTTALTSAFFQLRCMRKLSTSFILS